MAHESKLQYVFHLKINNYLPPQLGCNKPQPDPNVIVSCSKTSYNNYWNNNITPNIQWPYNIFTNLKSSWIINVQINTVKFLAIIYAA